MESSLNTRFGKGCQICFMDYDAKDKRPRCLPCGHSFCSSCISKSIQVQRLLCPNCRLEHQGTSMSDFPVNYELERMMQEDPNSSQAFTMNRQFMLMKKGMDASVKDMGTRGLETRSQLYQYKSDLGKWQSQHEETLKKHKIIVSQLEHIINKIKTEMKKVDKAIAKGDEEERKLKTAKNNLTVASTVQDISPALAKVDFHCASFKKWTVTTHRCFPDTELVIQSQELIERSKEGLLKLLEPSERDAGTAVLTEGPSSAAAPITTKDQHQGCVDAAAAAASSDATEMTCEEPGGDEDATLCPSIGEKVERALESISIRPMNQTVKTLEVQDLVNMTLYTRNLLNSGRVFAVKEVMGELCYARISVDKQSLFLHVLRKLDIISKDIISLQYDDVLRLFEDQAESLVDGASSSSSSSRLAFVELEEEIEGREGSKGRESLGRVLFRLSSPDDKDDETPLARQFVLHCTGENGTSLRGCQSVAEPQSDDEIPSCSNAPVVKRSRGNTTKAGHILNLVARNLEERSERRDTPNETFGKYVGQALNSLDKVTAGFAKKLMNDVLFEAENGNLTACSKIVTETYHSPLPQCSSSFNVSDNSNSDSNMSHYFANFQPL